MDPTKGVSQLWPELSHLALGLRCLKRSNDNGCTFKAGNSGIKTPNVPKGHSVVVKGARMEPLASTIFHLPKEYGTEVGEEYTRLQGFGRYVLFRSNLETDGEGGVVGAVGAVGQHFGHPPDLEESGSLVIVDSLGEKVSS